MRDDSGKPLEIAAVKSEQPFMAAFFHSYWSAYRASPHIRKLTRIWSKPRKDKKTGKPIKPTVFGIFASFPIDSLSRHRAGYAILVCREWMRNLAKALAPSAAKRLRACHVHNKSLYVRNEEPWACHHRYCLHCWCRRMMETMDTLFVEPAKKQKYVWLGVYAKEFSARNSTEAKREFKKLEGFLKKVPRPAVVWKYPIEDKGVMVRFRYVVLWKGQSHKDLSENAKERRFRKDDIDGACYFLAQAIEYPAVEILRINREQPARLQAMDNGFKGMRVSRTHHKSVRSNKRPGKTRIGAICEDLLRQQ